MHDCTKARATPLNVRVACCCRLAGKYSMNLILHDLSPIHWALAGAGIAATTLVLLFVANRRLGISTGLEDLCSLVLQQPYFRRGAIRSGRE